MSVVVVMPSRGRPQRARVACQAIRATASRVGTEVVVAIDATDPKRDEYHAALRFPDYGPEVSVVTLYAEDTGNLVRATNTIARRIVDSTPDAIIGNLGDDHLCRTPGWDVLVERALATPGIAYGDDLLQGELLPTAPFVSASIVRALGWYFLPRLRHMFVDDALRELGIATGTLRYLPDVVIEHMHPGAYKAEDDEGYRRADASTESDRARFTDWRTSHDFRAAVASIRALSEVAA